MRTHVDGFGKKVNSGLGRFLSILALTGSSLGIPERSWATHIQCSSILNVGVNVEYLPAPPELPTKIKFTVNVVYSQCGSTDVLKFRLFVFNADGGQVAMEEQTFPDGNCSTQQATKVYEYNICKKFIKCYRIDRFFGCPTGSWQTGPATDVPELVFNCPTGGGSLQTFMNDLECYTCRTTGVIADTELKFYKTKGQGSYTLYTLPECDTSCLTDDAHYSEVVNGDLIPTVDGLLLVKVEGASDAVDMYASGSADAPGWQVPPNQRNGQPVDPDQCIQLNSGQKYKFNIRTGRSDDPPDFKVIFDSYWWDSMDACLQHDERDLDIKVETMRLLTVDPLLPNRAQVTRSDGSVETELRIPACGTEDNPGNLTQWFIMWPTNDGQVIQEGYAKGWKIVGDTLIAPGPDGEEYEFSN